MPVPKAKPRKPEPRPTAIDLFCGAGGMSLGFEQAGFDVLLGVEMDGYHVATHERNFPYGKTLCRSVAQLTADEIFAALDGRRDIDVIFGGPPCQGFSNMGHRDAQDPRNTLVRQFARIVAEVKPKAFVMENVPGMLAGSTRPVLDDAIAFFEAAGYRVTQPVRVLDASQLGVPQRRKRLILLGVRNDIGTTANYPAGVPGRPTVLEAIGDLPDVDRVEELFRENATRYDRPPTSAYARVMRGVDADLSDFSHPRAWDATRCTGCLRVRHSDAAVALYAATAPGEMVPGHKLPRLDPDGTAPTLRAGSDSAHGSYTAPRPIHPSRPRCITAREAARLHGFPDWFDFYPLKWHAYRQIGNAVCPPVAKAIGAEVMRALGRTPTKPTQRVELTDVFALPADRPRTLRRVTQMDNYPPVVGHLFAQAFDAERRELCAAQFTFADVQRAISSTGVNLTWTRADTFLSEIARSRNVRRILEPCLSSGFTIREVSEGDAIGEFVRVGHSDGLEERGFLRVGTRELTAAIVLPGLGVQNLAPKSLFALLGRAEVVCELWPEATGVEVQKGRGADATTLSYPYRLAGVAGQPGAGLAVAFEAGNLPSRDRLARLMSATRLNELAVLIPVTNRHVLVARFSGRLELPQEVARRVFACEAPTAVKKARSRREQPSLF